jgi:hypothetical protein
MAVNYSNYPAYRAAFDKAQKLRTRLYGYKGYSNMGLADAMDDVATEKGEKSAEYIKLKALFDKTQAEYDAAVKEAESIREQIDIEAAKPNPADVAKEKKKKSAQVNQLIYERDSLKRQNKLEEAKAKQAQIDAILRPQTEEEKESAADIGLEEDKFSGYTLTDGVVTAEGGFQVIFVDVADGKGNVTPTAYKSKAQARDAFLKNYKGKDQIQGLISQLVQSNYLKQSKASDGVSWLTALDDMLIARTAKIVSDVKYGLGGVTTAEDFLKTKRDSGTGGAKVYRDLSTRGDARQQINDYLMDLTGSAATEEEYEEYYKALNAEEKRQTMTSANGTTTGDVMTDAERLVIAAKVARKRLKNTDVDALLSSSKGSRVSMDIAALQELAADYGIDMTAADALRQVTLGIGQKDYLQKQQERLRLIAKKMHPGLADHLDAGGTVAEIANVYARTKFTKLGTVVKTATKDKDVMDAVSSGKSIAQFEKELQANPMWRFTDEARETASDFLTTIGRMWGRG